MCNPDIHRGHNGSAAAQEERLPGVSRGAPSPRGWLIVFLAPEKKKYIYNVGVEDLKATSTSAKKKKMKVDHLSLLRGESFSTRIAGSSVGRVEGGKKLGAFVWLVQSRGNLSNNSVGGRRRRIPAAPLPGRILQTWPSRAELHRGYIDI